MQQLPPESYINRELSWLEFNQRVLEQAMHPKVPLLERLKFLAITGSNLDEFFMVRVGSLQIQQEQRPEARDPSGRSPEEQLQIVRDRVEAVVAEQYRCYLEQLEPNLRAEGIERVRLPEANLRHREAARRLFDQELYPIIGPMPVGDERLPLLTNLGIYLYARVRQRPLIPAADAAANPEAAAADHEDRDSRKGKRKRKGKGGDKDDKSGNKDDGDKSADAESVSDTQPLSGGAVEENAYLLPLGAATPRFFTLPSDKGYSFALAEDVLREFVGEYFPGDEIIEAVAFRITANSDITVREDMAADLLSGMEKVLSARRVADSVRLEIDAAASDEAVEFLRQRLQLDSRDIYRIPGPIRLSDMMQLTDAEGFAALRDPGWPPQRSPQIDPTVSMFETIASQDVLLCHPYESFEPVVRLLSEAAEDPEVLAIKQVLYRTSRTSSIIAALKRAAEKGKYVTAVVELKARFDEARNIEWARELERAGVQVVYGVKRLKTHAKVLLIVRREPHGVVRYMHFGTGNYNESTSRIYSDISYLTCNDELGVDASHFFNAITGYSQPQQFSRLQMAPLGLRRRLLMLIDGETQRKRQGGRASITAKLNSLVDPELIAALYRASSAGVPVRLNIRGQCCLLPGVPGLSENIEVVSIVDRFLEHARILQFHHGGDELLFISSADWMPRNLDRRVELLVPIEDPSSRRRLSSILETYFRDNQNAWQLQSDGTYLRLSPTKEQPKFRAQRALYDAAVSAIAQVEQTRRTTFEPHRPAE